MPSVTTHLCDDDEPVMTPPAEVMSLPVLNFSWLVTACTTGIAMPGETGKRVCTQCKLALPVESFSMNGKGYRRSECNPCRVVMNARYREQKKLLDSQKEAS